MSELTIYAVGPDVVERSRTRDPAAIASRIGAAGAAFSRWPTIDLADGASGEDVLAAYSDEIARIRKEGGYRSADVISIGPTHPARTELREKFLAEHTHDDDEIRFFVQGRGAFYIRDGAEILKLDCEQGDFIHVPRGARHWFDMGAEPSFTCIRIFHDEKGWAAQFTGDDISRRVPQFENGPAVAG